MNRNITVSIRLVDGGFIKYVADEEFLSRLKALERQGLTGKALVNQLISDDWAAPPLTVQIFGTDQDGRSVDISIPYN